MALVNELQLTPPIYRDDNGKAYFKCDYSSIRISSAFTFPEAILKGRAAKDNTARQRGRFFDVNCAFAWLKERKERITIELYQHCLNYMAEQVQLAQHQETLLPAPPAKWLECNGGNKSEEEWLAAYKGTSLHVAHITAAEDDALRRVVLEDRKRQREKAAAEKAAKNKESSADAMEVTEGERAAAVPIADLGELVAAKAVASKLKKSSSSSAISSAVAVAAPLSEEKEKKPKKKRSAKEAASSGDAVEPKVKAAPRKKVVKDAADGAAAPAPVAVAVEAKPTKAVKAPKKEVATQLPRKKQTMNVAMRGKKSSGEVPDVYSAFTKAFVASASQFEAPEYAALVTMNAKGDLCMRPLDGRGCVTVPGMHMADISEF